MFRMLTAFGMSRRLGRNPQRPPTRHVATDFTSEGLLNIPVEIFWHPRGGPRSSTPTYGPHQKT